MVKQIPDFGFSRFLLSKVQFSRFQFLVSSDSSLADCGLADIWKVIYTIPAWQSMVYQIPEICSSESGFAEYGLAK